MTGEELYRRYLEGDKQAFDEIIRLYHDSLIYFLYGITKNYEDAEDSAIDAFAALLVNKHRFSFRSSLKSYLFSIGRHKAVEIVRKRGRFGKQEELNPGIIDNSPSPEEAVIKDSEKQMLKNALKEINQNYRLVLHLVYFENMTIAEAATVMGKSKKYIENRLYRGKVSVKQILEKNYGYSPSEVAKITD